jgi:hypothetical protein
VKELSFIRTRGFASISGLAATDARPNPWERVYPGSVAREPINSNQWCGRAIAVVDSRARIITKGLVATRNAAGHDRKLGTGGWENAKAAGGVPGSSRSNHKKLGSSSGTPLGLGNGCTIEADSRSVHEEHTNSY